MPRTGRAIANQCPLLALSGHLLLHRSCPLSGAKRTWPVAAHTSAYDPKRTPGRIVIRECRFRKGAATQLAACSSIVQRPRHRRGGVAWPTPSKSTPINLPSGTGRAAIYGWHDRSTPTSPWRRCRRYQRSTSVLFDLGRILYWCARRLRLGQKSILNSALSNGRNGLGGFNAWLDCRRPDRIQLAI